MFETTNQPHIVGKSMAFGFDFSEKKQSIVSIELIL